MSNLSQAASNTVPRMPLSPVESLVNEFNSEDGGVRERARRAVVRIGPPAVAELVRVIGHAGVRARWEATRALCEIGDAAAVPALGGRLEGSDSGIRWMAADGLIKIGRP